jgi:hypothetical protein
MATVLALESFSSVIKALAKVLRSTAPRAAETVWPASMLQGTLALFFFPKGLHELCEGKALLVLDPVLG